MADLFDMQAKAAALDAAFGMSEHGYTVLADLCRTFANDLDHFLGRASETNEIPTEERLVVRRDARGIVHTKTVDRHRRR